MSQVHQEDINTGGLNPLPLNFIPLKTIHCCPPALWPQRDCLSTWVLPEQSQYREATGMCPPGNCCQIWKSDPRQAQRSLETRCWIQSLWCHGKIVFSGLQKPWATSSTFGVSPVWSKILDYGSQEVTSNLNFSVSLWFSLMSFLEQSAMTYRNTMI